MADSYTTIREITDTSTPIQRAERLSAARVADTGEGEADYLLLANLKSRKEALEPEQARLRSLFDRMDNLYNPMTITNPGGADHWPVGNPQGGSVHVSVNNIHAYVQIPAGLQSLTPVENVPSPASDDKEREAAARVEELYFGWKDEEDFELKYHRACLAKELYGITYGKVWWNKAEKRPSVTVIDRPENLYVGWGASDYSRIDWAVYCYGLSPQAIEEEYGLFVVPVSANKTVSPYVTGDHSDPIATKFSSPVYGKQRDNYEQTQVEVYDYWYKKVEGGKTKVWNALFVGNELVSNAPHPEFDDIPYVPLANGIQPGSPYGVPALYPLEQLFREIDERTTNAAQMLQAVVGGQMWQLTGPDAPDEVPTQAIPKVNKVAAPGAGNRLEAIQPFVPQFAIADYIHEIKDFLVEASGINDVLLGKTPNQLVSSKALSALVAQYGARIKLPRDLAYQWRKRMWKIAAMCWERKDRDIKRLIAGRYRLDLTPPDLTPRDELENTQRAINLGQNGYWSRRRVMDQTGVEDPEDEINLIIEERSNPALDPAAVQAQVTLAAALAQFGQQGGALPGQPQGGQNPANGPTPAAGTPSLNGPENAANPPASSLPTNALAPNGAKAQTLVQGGEATGRILSSQPLG